MKKAHSCEKNWISEKGVRKNQRNRLLQIISGPNYMKPSIFLFFSIELVADYDITLVAQELRLW